MKTTVEIPDSLLDEDRGVAEREATPVQALIEEGRKSSFQGQGLRPAIVEGSWQRLRDLAYEAHGA